MPLETTPFDAAQHLDTPESQIELINDALVSGDANYLKVALGTVARARGMTNVSQQAGVTRASLYKALSEEGDPRLSTLLGVLSALNVQMTARSTDPILENSDPG